MFSFMTPVYNGGRYLAKTLDSVIAQTFPEWEMILVVDQASTDDTLKIAEAYAARDERIRVFPVPHCKANDKLNFAMQHARYNWVCGLDADDIAFPERLAVQKAAIDRQPDVIAWAGFAHYFNDKGDILFLSQLGPTTEMEFTATRERNEPIMMSHSAMTYRRDIALQLGGYNDNLFTCSDIDLCDRMSDCGLMLTVPQPLVYYRVHAGSTSMKKFDQQAYQLRYIWERRAAQNQGKTLSWSEYQEIQGTLAPTRYFQQWAIDHSRLYWREAGLAWGEKHYGQLAKNLIFSTALNPSFVGSKILKQVNRRLKLRSQKALKADPNGSSPKQNHE